MDKVFVDETVGDVFLAFRFEDREPQLEVYDWEREDAKERHPSNYKRGN